VLPTDVDENEEKLMKLGSLKIELDLVACKPDALNKAGLHRQKEKGALNRECVQAQGMATSQILELHSRYTIKSHARFLVSTFTGVAPCLVCHGFPSHPA